MQRRVDSSTGEGDRRTQQRNRNIKAKDLFWFTIQITHFFSSFINITETHMIM